MRLTPLSFLLTVVMLNCVALAIPSCGEAARSAPAIQGPIKQDAPATKNAPADVQAAISNVANATASGDPKAERAAGTQLVETKKAEDEASLSPFYPIAVLALIVAAVLAYMKDWKWAGAAAVAGGAAVYGTIVVQAAIQHSEALVTAGILALVGLLVWRNRVKLEADAVVAESKLKTYIIALEHAVAHVHLATLVSHSAWEVEHLVQSAWYKVKADAEVIALKLRLIKATALTTVAAAAEPIAPAPAAPSAATLMATPTETK